jgi:hypothetical protein
MRFSRRREELAVGLFRICCTSLSEPRRSSRTVQDSPIAVIGALGYSKSKEGWIAFQARKHEQICVFSQENAASVVTSKAM